VLFYANYLYQRGDATELASLALSKWRTNCHFARSGGYSTAVTELRLGARLLARSPAAPLGTCAAISLAVAALVNRSSQVDPRVIALLADLGDADRALRIASNTPDSWSRDAMLSGIAMALLSRGKGNDSLEVARGIDRADERARVCSYIASHDRPSNQHTRRQALLEAESALSFSRLVDEASDLFVPANAISLLRTAARRYPYRAVECLRQAFMLALSTGMSEEDASAHLEAALPYLADMEEDNASRAWSGIASSLKDASVKLRRRIAADALAIARRKRSPTLVARVAASLYQLEPALAEEAWKDAVDSVQSKRPDQAPRLYAWLSSAQSSAGSPEAKASFSRAITAMRGVQGLGVYTRAARLMHQADDLLTAASALGASDVRRVLELLLAAIDSEQQEKEYVSHLATVVSLARSHGENEVADRTATRAVEAARSITDPSDRSSALNSIAHYGEFDDTQLASLFQEALAAALDVPAHDRRADQVYNICWSAAYRLDAVRAAALFRLLEKAAHDIRGTKRRAAIFSILAHSAQKADDAEAKRLLGEALAPSALTVDDADFRIRYLLLESRAALRARRQRRVREILRSARPILAEEFSETDVLGRPNWWSSRVQMHTLSRLSSSRLRPFRQDDLAVLRSALEAVPPGALATEPDFLSSVVELATVQQASGKRAEGYMAIASWLRHTSTDMSGELLDWVDGACAHLPIPELLKVLHHLLDAEFFSGDAFGAVFLRVARVSPCHSDRRMTRALLAASSDVVQRYQRDAQRYGAPLWQNGLSSVANAVLLLIAGAISTGGDANAMPVLSALSELTGPQSADRRLNIELGLRPECYVARALYLLGELDEWEQRLDGLTSIEQPPVMAALTKALADPPHTTENVQSALEWLHASDQEPAVRVKMLNACIDITLDALDGANRIMSLKRIGEIATGSLELELRTPIRLKLARTFAFVGDRDAAAHYLSAILADISTAGWGNGSHRYARLVADLASRLGLKDVLVATSAVSVEPFALSSLFPQRALDVLRHAVAYDMTTAAVFLQDFDRWKGVNY
jgi:hypothetical protein